MYIYSSAAAALRAALSLGLKIGNGNTGKQK
jgi:hypothetical protein